MDQDEATRRLADAASVVMVSDRFRFSAAEREDVLRLVAVGGLLGGRDTSGLSDDELRAKVLEACPPPVVRRRS